MQAKKKTIPQLKRVDVATNSIGYTRKPNPFLFSLGLRRRRKSRLRQERKRESSETSFQEIFCVFFWYHRMVAGARCIALKVDTLSHQLGSFNNNRCNLGVFIRSSRLSVRAKLGQQQPNCNDKKLLQDFEHFRVCQWQSSCAILNSHLVGNEEVEKKSQASSSETGLVTTSTSSFSLLPRPLSIADLAPAPMHGSQLRVAYQGVPGAYSEAAASKAYPDCDAVPCDQFEAAFQAVELWVADRAVLPVENSLGGSIHRNYDLLLRHRLHIVGEVQLPVHHCLLALPGTRKEDLRRVISHPQALSQCEHTLTKLGLKVAREAFDDTALAAQVVAEQYLRDTAAIASARAADIYGLTILADGIQDDASNVTRFVMLAREPVIPRVDRPFKTSIVFAHDEGTGILFKVLSAFAFRDISLTKIESRPQRNRPLRVVDDSNSGTAKYFEYLFYIDFEASMADPRAQNALAELQEFTNFLRVLGSYPMDMSPLVKTP